VAKVVEFVMTWYVIVQWLWEDFIWYSSLQRIDEYPVYVHSLFARMIRAVFNRVFHIQKSVSSEQLLGTHTHSNSMPKLFCDKYNCRSVQVLP
jgi:hypothetical protein